MYIRRKVFSVALDEYGEERYFSTSEILSEEAYLDEVMYSSKKKKEEGSSRGKKIALGTAGALGAGAAGIYGAEAVGKRMVEKNKARLKDPKTWGRIFDADKRSKARTGEKLQIPAKYVNAKGKAAADWVKNNKGKTALIAVPASALAGYGVYRATKKD